MKTKLYLFSVAALLISGCAKDEVETLATVTGTVTEYASANSPISGATVSIDPLGLSKTTNSKGQYTFTDITPGTYTMNVSANNYVSDSKTLTTYAGQTSTVDFQLSQSSAAVTINPLTLNFGTNIDQLPFNIQNDGSSALQFSITDYPSYLSVSPASGQIAAKSKQAVVVKLNRSLVGENSTAQMIVNVGNDSYTVSINVGSQDISAKLAVSPTSLDFSTDKTSLQFAVKNTGSYGDLAWTITTPQNACFSVSPKSGTTSPGGQKLVTVTLDRTNLSAYAQNGKVDDYINVETADDAAVVKLAATVEGSSTDPDNPSTDPDEESSENVTSGLYAYFTFDDNANDSESGLSGTTSGVSYVTSYDGTKAIRIPASSSNYVNVPDPLIDQNAMSISFWAKDLEEGLIFHVKKSSNNRPCFSLSVSGGQLKFIASNYNNNYQYSSCTSFTSGSLTGWHMITIVSSFDSAYCYATTKLYVDGQYKDEVSEHNTSEGVSDYKVYNAGKCFILGGSMTGNNGYSTLVNPAKLTIDNLRVYKYRELTSSEIQSIYNYEKK